MQSRHGRYWKIANPRFLVEWNSMKMRCINTVFMLFKKIIPKLNLVKFSSNAIVLKTSAVLESLPQFWDDFLK